MKILLRKKIKMANKIYTNNKIFNKYNPMNQIINNRAMKLIIYKITDNRNKL